LTMIHRAKLGISLYMQQGGRGIGLTNKIRAYMLQDRGDDTYEVNVDLGFKADERDYEVAATMLGRLHIRSIKLLTNNPEKIAALERYGVKITRRIPLETRSNRYNRRYLETKKTRLGHFLSLRSTPGKSDPLVCSPRERRNDVEMRVNRILSSVGRQEVVYRLGEGKNRELELLILALFCSPLSSSPAS